VIILYKCNLCGNSIKKYYHSDTKQSNFLNCECSGIMERQVPDFGTSSLEIIDNGSMAKRVELRKDANVKFKEKGDIYIKTKEERDSVLGIKKEEDKK
jgi:hypothetical protein